ncbi:hypothetical protein DFA_02008 [Cavenderia fasciculata]|uniref:Fungal lipase-type domain-containing protein n=1 Tax=Cavenderia fasciculata TaxID=261658 RepID=F4PRC4_CACFS|nr:uncharacterized protein DFA_02008 [Cavenderia fasciculata]EGG22118.1 hypothetical protein DFA_02008 [Cavenderia fasciculata]|eukprot:XP_004359969.1 hypothetical protein DFA_02008 [Cavenderia fasciculata]
MSYDFSLYCCSLLEESSPLLSSLSPLFHFCNGNERNTYKHLYFIDDQKLQVYLAIGDSTDLLPSGVMEPLDNQKPENGSVDSAYIGIVNRYFHVQPLEYYLLKNYSVHVVGYSSGGCIAQALTALLVSRVNYKLTTSLSCITFGSAPVWDKATTIFLKAHHFSDTIFTNFLLTDDHYHRTLVYASSSNFDLYPLFRVLLGRYKRKENPVLSPEYEEMVNDLHKLIPNQEYDTSFGTWIHSMSSLPLGVGMYESPETIFTKGLKQGFPHNKGFKAYLMALDIDEKLVKEKIQAPDLVQEPAIFKTSSYNVDTAIFNPSSNQMVAKISGINLHMFSDCESQSQWTAAIDRKETHSLEITIHNANLHYLSTFKLKIVQPYHNSKFSNRYLWIEIPSKTIKYSEELFLTHILRLSMFHLAICGENGDLEMEQRLVELDELLGVEVDLVPDDTSRLSLLQGSGEIIDQALEDELITCSRIAASKNSEYEELQKIVANPKEFIKQTDKSKSIHLEKYWSSIQTNTLDVYQKEYLLPCIPFGQLVKKWKSMFSASKASKKKPPFVRSLFEAIQPAIYLVVLRQLNAPLPSLTPFYWGSIFRTLGEKLKTWFPNLFPHFSLDKADKEYHLRVNLLYFYAQGQYNLDDMQLSSPKTLQEMELNVVDHLLKMASSFGSQFDNEIYMQVPHPIFHHKFNNQDRSNIVKFLNVVSPINQLRKSIINRSYISIFGVQNVGKSSLLSFGWGCNTSPSVCNNTLDPSCYYVYSQQGDEIKSPCFVDWPAATDSDYGKSNLGDLILPWSKVCICILGLENANDTPSLDVVQFLSKNGVKVLILLSMADIMWGKIKDDHVKIDDDAHQQEWGSDDQEVKVDMDAVKESFWKRGITKKKR